jgi:hypothetical protein
MSSRPRARGSGSPMGRFGPAVGVGLERVKGIEPSSHAWEARALPLSYTRPFPKGMDYPRGGSHPPLGVVCKQTHLAIGHHVEVSALLGRGIIAPVSIPLPNGVRFFHNPLSATGGARPYNRTCRIPPRRCYGLTRFRATSTKPGASTGFRLPVSRDHPGGRQCASHKVVTKPALHLGYRWLNTGSHSDLVVVRQLATRLSARFDNPFPPRGGWSDPEKGHLRGWFSTLDTCLRA